MILTMHRPINVMVYTFYSIVYYHDYYLKLMITNVFLF